MSRRVGASCTFAVFMLVASTGLPATGRVVVMQPAAAFADERWPQAEQRIAIELGNAGFEPVSEAMEARGEAERRGAMVRAAEQRDAIGALLLTRMVHDKSAMLWFHDRITNKVVTRAVSPGSSEKVVALRALELLHASLIELRLPSVEPVVVPPAIVMRTLEKLLPSEPTRSRRVELAVQPLALWQGDEPSIRGGVGISAHALATSRLALGVTGFYAPLGAALESPLGTASLASWGTFAELAWTAWRSDDVAASLYCGAGATAIEIDGRAQAPYRARSRWLWSPAAVAGGVATWGVSELVSLRLGASMLWRTNDADLRFGDVVAGRVSRFGVLLHAGPVLSL